VERPIDFVREGCAGLSDDQIRGVMYQNARDFLDG
jgi:hypothetical protein